MHVFSRYRCGENAQEQHLDTTSRMSVMQCTYPVTAVDMPNEGNYKNVLAYQVHKAKRE